MHDVTRRFRDAPLNRPENGLVGIMFSETTGGQFPLIVANPPAGSDAAAFLAAAGVSAGDNLGDYVRSEGDQPFSNGYGPDNLQILTRSFFVPNGTTSYEHAYYSSFYVAPSGAGVFAAGNNDFGRGLESVYSSPEPRIQRLFKSVVDWMTTR